MVLILFSFKPLGALLLTAKRVALGTMSPKIVAVKVIYATYVWQTWKGEILKADAPRLLKVCHDMLHHGQLQSFS